MKDIMNSLNFEVIERDYVHVRVPATTANMGPGFDCMGKFNGMEGGD